MNASRYLGTALAVVSLATVYHLYSQSIEVKNFRAQRLAGVQALAELTHPPLQGESMSRRLDVVINQADLLQQAGYDPEVVEDLRSHKVELAEGKSTPLALMERQQALNSVEIPQLEASITVSLALLGVCSVGLLLTALWYSGPLPKEEPNPKPPAKPEPSPPLSFTEVAIEARAPDPEKGISARGYTERVLQSLSNFLVLTDRFGQIQLVNVAVCDSLGYQQSELMGQPISQLMPPECSKLATRPGDYEAVYLGKNGKKIPVLVSCSEVFDQEKKFDGLVVVAQDISERHKAEIALKEREAKLRVLAERLVTAQESERQRVARDLHDGMLQSVIAAELQLSSFLRRLKKSESSLDSKPLVEGVDCLKEAVGQGRLLINDLRPPTLDKFGLAKSLRQETEKLGRTLGCEAEMDCAEDLEALPHQVETALFRICQEAFNNIRKYAKPKSVRVTLETQGSELVLRVIDDGVGFDPSTTEKGVGQDSMRERAELLGGLFSLESNEGAGTKIEARVPLTG